MQWLFVIIFHKTVNGVNKQRQIKLGTCYLTDVPMPALSFPALIGVKLNCIVVYEIS